MDAILAVVFVDGGCSRRERTSSKSKDEGATMRREGRSLCEESSSNCNVGWEDRAETVMVTVKVMIEGNGAKKSYSDIGGREARPMTQERPAR